ncbi:MAG TPA: hypothetical protein VLM80_05530 [Anaerolineales bacterium]|nr:hypothetical protein [Anaerolineales bacterium]
MPAIEKMSVCLGGLQQCALADWYLGEVSHTGPSGLLGLTLV